MEWDTENPFAESAKDHPWLLLSMILSGFNDKLMEEKCQFQVEFNEIFTMS
jgi:hypothetical protein